MRWKVLVLGVLLVLFVSLVVAFTPQKPTLPTSEIKVNSVQLQKEYYKGDPLKGTISLLMNNIPFDADITSNRGEKISLKHLLEYNGISDVCNPLDCSSGYLPYTPSDSLSVPVSEGNDSYVGFFITGE